MWERDLEEFSIWNIWVNNYWNTRIYLVDVVSLNLGYFESHNKLPN
jgi:hypothetical protein